MLNSLYIRLCFTLLSNMCFKIEAFTESHRLSVGDSYRLLGNPGLRYMGQCNMTYAWLVPPPASTLDAYGHALACNRLGLKDGRVIHSTFIEQLADRESKREAEADVGSVNKENNAAIVDLSRLDALLRADPRGNGRYVSGASSQLADEDRYFFLADRIGDLNVMVLLRPGQPTKIELIDPFTSNHLFTPQHVLCYRKQCPKSQASVADAATDRTTNISNYMSTAIARAERQNRELYMQLVISRVACALLGVLCVVFAVTSLVLCLRFRKSPPVFRRKSHPSELSIYRDAHPSPTYFQPNGKICVGQPSPAFLTDHNQRHHMPNDNTSVTNLVMTASNLSDCGAVPGFHGAPISYTAINSPYGHLAAYPVSAGCGSLYNENTGLLAYVPVNTRGVVMPYQNGASSPVPSNHSVGEPKASIVRTGSIGKYSGSNISCGENGKRSAFRMSRSHVVPNPADSHNQGLIQLKQNSRETSTEQMSVTDIKGRSYGVSRPADLEQSVANQSQVIHRYPSEHLSTYSKLHTPSESVNGDRGSVRSNNMNNVHEPNVGLVRKPALSNI